MDRWKVAVRHEGLAVVHRFEVEAETLTGACWLGLREYDRKSLGHDGSQTSEVVGVWRLDARFDDGS